MIGVILVCKDSNKFLRIEKEMLFELIEKIEKEKEVIVKTNKKEYIVQGLMIGDLKDKIFFT